MTLSYLRGQHSSRAAARGLGPRILSQVALVRMGRRTFLTALHRGVIGIVCDNRLGSICRCVRVYLRRRQFWSRRFARPPGRKYRPRSGSQLRQRLRLPRQLPRLNRGHLARRQPRRVMPRRIRRGAARRCRLFKSPHSARNRQLHPTLSRLQERRLRLLLLLRHRPSRPALPMSREEPRLCRRWRAR